MATATSAPDHTQVSRLKPWPISGVAILQVATSLLMIDCVHPLATLGATAQVALAADGIRGEYVQASPSRIHYYAGGEGPPVIFVHGLGAEAVTWIEPLIITKHRGHRVYAVDLLGHGRSAKPDIAYSIEDQSQMLLEFLAGQTLPLPISSVCRWGMDPAQLRD